LKLAAEMLKGVAEKAGLLDDNDNNVDEEEDCGDCELMKVCNGEQAIAYRKAHGIPRPKKGKGHKVNIN
jgi:radical SAM protein with 4Fe4S-binding SPASM domain